MKQSDKGQRMTDLIQKAKNGDQFAIEEIMEKYRPLLKSMCRQFFLAGIDEDDLMQEAMLGMFQAINTYNAERNDNFTSYAHKCVTNKLISVARQGNQQRFILINTALPIDSEGALESNKDNIEKLIVVTDEYNFEEKFYTKEAMIQTNKVIRELISQQDYDILSLYLSGYKYDEIASKIDSTSKLVDNRLQSIKRILNKNKEKIFKGE